MRLFCAGFNLYGQFHNSNDLCVEKYTELLSDNIIDVQLGHTFLIIIPQQNEPENGTLYLHGFANGKTHQTKVLNFERNISQLSVNDSNVLCLDCNGKLWMLATDEYKINAVVNFLNTECSAEEFSDEVVRVSCGCTMSCVSTRFGYLYNIPTRIDCKFPNVKDLRIGKEHCLILTEDGLVYSFGGGSRGQLGHGDVEDQSEPIQIEAFGGIRIAKINCGAWHSAVVSTEGDLYMWGWNSNGQLGLKTNTNDRDNDVTIMASPRAIDFENNVVDVACGTRHTIVLLENRKLYGCGWNKYCQLGSKSALENLEKMTYLHDFGNLNVIGLRCGPWNSVVLVT